MAGGTKMMKDVSLCTADNVAYTILLQKYCVGNSAHVHCLAHICLETHAQCCEILPFIAGSPGSPFCPASPGSPFCLGTLGSHHFCWNLHTWCWYNIKWHCNSTVTDTKWHKENNVTGRHYSDRRQIDTNIYILRHNSTNMLISYSEWE